MKPLTEPCLHSPFPLAVSSWQPAPARMNKLFRPPPPSLFFSRRPPLSSFPSLRLWRHSCEPEVISMEPGRPLLRPVSARAKPGRSSPHFPPPPVAPVKLEARCSVPAARRRRRRCLTVGPVFRQSDRSQPARPEKPGNRRCAAHTSPSQHLHPSLRLSVFREATLVLRLFILPSLESPSPTFLSLFR